MLSILFEILTSDDMQDGASDMLWFYWSIKKWSKLGQKADFLLILRVFLFMPSYTLWVMPQDFAKWKALLRYISVASFISVAFVGVKLKIFKVVRIDPAFMKWPLLGVFGSLLPQIFFNLAEILTRCSVPIRKTQCLKNPSKFWILTQMEVQLGPKMLQNCKLWVR